MSRGTCLTCGRYGPVELHHVAGRQNMPELVVPVCPDDHRVLTNWQYAAGIALDADAPRHLTDVRRALGVGYFHLIRLIDQRAETRTAPDRLWLLTARAMSRAFDVFAPPDRDGRWLPDPIVEPETAPPVVIDPQQEQVQMRELMYLVGKVVRIVGEMGPITVEAWDRVLANLDSLPRRLAAVEAGDHAGPSLALMIEQHLESAMRVMQWLVTVDDWSAIDERDLNEARVWFATGEAILEKIIRAATSGEHAA